MVALTDELQKAARQMRYHGAHEMRHLIEKYYQTDYFVTLCFYHRISYEVAVFKFKEAIQMVSKKKGRVWKPERVQKEVKERVAIRTRRNGVNIKTQLTKKIINMDEDMYMGRWNVSPMLDTHISWWAFYDYQPNRNKRNLGGKVLHFHLGVDLDDYRSISEVKRVFESVWWFGDVNIRKYTHDDRAIEYCDEKHEFFSSGVSCRREKRGVDRLCCKSGRVCRYVTEDGHYSGMWFERDLYTN